MKASKFIFLLILTMLASACAAMQRAPMPEADLASAYIWAVERAAENRATTIYWVNPPTNEEVEKKIERD